MQQATIKLPDKLLNVFDFNDGSRYRGAYGGRGSGKSYSFALMCLVRAYQEPIRILCARELQNSIKESVHSQLISVLKSIPWLASNFEWGQSFIRGKNGSEFIFKGIRSDVEESIKSIEGIKICWVEEAEKVSEESWSILTPTIRASGSEIWLTWNPADKNSATTKRFLDNPPHNAKIIKLNYSNNPWFPDVLEMERLNDKRARPDDYGHVWEGEFRSLRDNNAVFKGFKALHKVEPTDFGAIDVGRPLLRAWDFGMTCACIIGQTDNMGRLRILKEFVLEDSNTEEIAGIVQQWEAMHLPKGVTWSDTCDPAGNTKGFATSHDVSHVANLNKLGIYPRFDRVLENRLIKNGVDALKSLMGKLIDGSPAFQVDALNCPTLVEALEHGYRYKSSRYDDKQEAFEGKHPYEDVIDCLRYLFIENVGIHSTAKQTYYSRGKRHNG